MTTATNPQKAAPASNGASTTKATKPALHSPAVRRGVIAAFSRIIEDGGGTQDLRKYLNRGQIARLDRDAVAAGFTCAAFYLEAFMSKGIAGLIEKAGSDRTVDAEITVDDQRRLQAIADEIGIPVWNIHWHLLEYALEEYEAKRISLVRMTKKGPAA